MLALASATPAACAAARAAASAAPLASRSAAALPRALAASAGSVDSTAAKRSGEDSLMRMRSLRRRDRSERALLRSSADRAANTLPASMLSSAAEGGGEGDCRLVFAASCTTKGDDCSTTGVGGGTDGDGSGDARSVLD